LTREHVKVALTGDGGDELLPVMSALPPLGSLRFIGARRIIARRDQPNGSRIARIHLVPWACAPARRFVERTAASPERYLEWVSIQARFLARAFDRRD
jgi:hypothetical protein